jgi:CxxC motif-containing protein (DUF1111 family)
MGLMPIPSGGSAIPLIPSLIPQRLARYLKLAFLLGTVVPPQLISAQEYPHNAVSCQECHSAPTAFGSSLVSVERAGTEEEGVFVPAIEGGIHHRIGSAKGARRGKTVLLGERITISILGDSYIEAIDPKAIVRNAERSHPDNPEIKGMISYAPILESRLKVSQPGRFGWKAQHASLLSSCADSMRNELGTRNRLYPEEYSTHDPKADPTPFDTVNDTGQSLLERVVDEVRHLNPPSRDKQLSKSPDAMEGQKLFQRIGCSACHIPRYTTLPVGSVINNGTYRIPEYLGNKIIEPFSDFLLHDVGTGDGIPQAAKPEFLSQLTANRFRTPPLWGLRFRSWMMHDGKSVTYHQAIMRHGGEASRVRERYEALSPQDKQRLRTFLNSL